MARCHAAAARSLYVAGVVCSSPVQHCLLLQRTLVYRHMLFVGLLCLLQEGPACLKICAVLLLYKMYSRLSVCLSEQALVMCDIPGVLLLTILVM